MRRVLAAAAILSFLVLAGCGNDDQPAVSSESGTPSGDASAPSSAVEVTAQDIEFPEDTYEASAGTVELVYENEGSIAHTLVIEDVDGFKLEVESEGDTDEGSVELEAGTYTLYCDVPGHRDAGMEATLEVS